MGYKAYPVQYHEHTLRESWGFRKDENYYTDRNIIRSIDRYLARDANYLLNVGPTSEGIIDGHSTGILRRIGDWYHKIEEALSGVEILPYFTTNHNVLVTRREDTVYIHLVNDPPGDGMKLPPVDIMPRKATLLNTVLIIKLEFDRLQAYLDMNFTD